jgi:hypothetical protein
MPSDQIKVNPGQGLEKKVVKVVFELSNNQRKVFEVPVSDNEFMSPSQALNKIINIQDLSGSHMYRDGSLMSITDSKQMKPGDLIRVQYHAVGGMGQTATPSFKMNPAESK